MRRRTTASPFLILGVTLFLWISLPKPVVDEIRSFTVASLAPTWKWTRGVERYLSDRPDRFWGERKGADSEQLSRLQLENQVLRTQMLRISEWLASEQRIKEQLEILNGLSREQAQAKEGSWRDFFERRTAHLRDLLKWELMAMPAQAIYRDPSSWSSSLWINVGEEDNRIMGRTVIAKNSPVVAGVALIGVVDYVGKKQSRVRLITDSGLCPSVRAVRGAAQKREIASLASALIERLDASFDGMNPSALLDQLEALKKNLVAGWDENYLAKGELHGSSSPFWRSRRPLLKGIGFNFDYADEEGSKRNEIPILKEGDTLVTTGLDGVFPPDLLVGRVAKVYPVKAGGYAHEIEARPAAPHFNDLETLFVLPPRGD